MESAYKNLSLFFIVILAFVVWGFFRTYFGLFPHFSGITTVQHFHGAMLLSWFVMLIVQPMLIRYRKFELHAECKEYRYPHAIHDRYFIADAWARHREGFHYLWRYALSAGCGILYDIDGNHYSSINCV